MDRTSLANRVVLRDNMNNNGGYDMKGSTRKSSAETSLRKKNALTPADWGRRFNQPIKCAKSEEDLDAASVCSNELVYKSSSLAVIKHKKHSKEQGPSAKAACPPYLQAAQKVMDFIRNMWLEQKFCDMILVLADGELLVHKVVFVAHSPALAEILRHYSPNKIISIHLTDFTSSAVFQIAKFLYTAELNLTLENIGEVYHCSSELGLETVFQYAREFLSNYNVNCAIQFFSICKTHGITDLRDEILHFISSNFLEIMQLESFLHIQLQDLIQLLTCDHLYVPNELEIFFAVCAWVKYDMKRRLAFSNQLLQCVRFMLIDLNTTIMRVLPIDWIFEPTENSIFMFEVFK